MERQISFLLAMLNVYLGFRVVSGTFAAATVLLQLVLVACIWFSDAMGAYQFPVWHRASPGAWVRIMAWILMVGLTLVLLITFIVTGERVG